jgi:hypothetical protein
MSNNKKEHSLFVKVVDGRVTGEAKGDAAKLINAVINFMEDNQAFEQLLTTAVSIFQFRKMIKENAERIEQVEQTLNQQL